MDEIKSIKSWVAFQKVNPNLHTKIIKATAYLDETACLRQRLWHIEHAQENIPTCITCGTQVKWHHVKQKYNPTCSTKCANNLTDKKEKIKTTTKERHGCENFARTPEYRAKRDATNLLKYNTTKPQSIPEIKQKQADTMMKRYGVTVPLHNSNIKEKQRKTLEQRYGVSNISHRYISTDTLAKINDKDWLVDQHIGQKKTITEIADQLDFDMSTLCVHFRTLGIDINKTITQSSQEREIIDFIKTLDSDINICTNTRSIIPPYELDIWLPQYNLAIEVCGLYWHSTEFKTSQYHHNKYVMCRDKGIRLITLFDDEWNANKQIVKSFLSYTIGKNYAQIPARKCCVDYNPDPRQIRDFFETYHIQGNGPGSIKIALTHNHMCVAAMCFINTHHGNYILNRYCSLGVTGGFTKLLSAFKRRYPWKKITTFADLRWGQGDLYVKTGFVCDKILPPDYYYVSHDKKKRIHKFNFRRKHLARILPVFDESLTEKENCYNSGYHMIYDCGKLRFTLENSS